MLSALAGHGLRIAALAGRAATICLLTPIVVLLSVAAFVALAVVGTARLARPSPVAPVAETRALPADVQFIASMRADRAEGVAVRQAA